MWNRYNFPVFLLSKNSTVTVQEVIELFRILKSISFAICCLIIVQMGISYKDSCAG